MTMPTRAPVEGFLLPPGCETDAFGFNFAQDTKLLFSLTTYFDRGSWLLRAHVPLSLPEKTNPAHLLLFEQAPKHPPYPPASIGIIFVEAKVLSEPQLILYVMPELSLNILLLAPGHAGGELELD